jgi:hypothetical protein
MLAARLATDVQRADEIVRSAGSLLADWSRLCSFFEKRFSLGYFSHWEFTA